MEKEKENKGAKHKNKAVKNNYSEKLRKASRLPKGSGPDMKDKGGGGGGGSGGTREGGGYVRKGGGGGGGPGAGHKVGHGSFPDYLPPAEVIKGLRDKTLIEGVLRINPKSYEDAFISSPEARDQDIYIKVGVKTLNPLEFKYTS